jgi:hypothetical protein
MVRGRSDDNWYALVRTAEVLMSAAASEFCKPDDSGKKATRSARTSYRQSMSSCVILVSMMALPPGLLDAL